MPTHEELLTHANEILQPALEKLTAAGLEIAAIVTIADGPPGAPAVIAGTMNDLERAYELLAGSFVTWRCARPRRDPLAWTPSDTAPLTLVAQDDEPWIEGMITALKPGCFELTLSCGTVRIEQEANTAAEAMTFAEAWREALWYWNRVATRARAQQPQSEGAPR